MINFISCFYSLSCHYPIPHSYCLFPRLMTLMFILWLMYFNQGHLGDQWIEIPHRSLVASIVGTQLKLILCPPPVSVAVVHFDGHSSLSSSSFYTWLLAGTSLWKSGVSIWHEFRGTMPMLCPKDCISWQFSLLLGDYTLLTPSSDMPMSLRRSGINIFLKVETSVPTTGGFKNRTSKWL